MTKCADLFFFLDSIFFWQKQRNNNLVWIVAGSACRGSCEVSVGPASLHRPTAADLEGGAVLGSGAVHVFIKSLPAAI